MLTNAPFAESLQDWLSKEEKHRAMDATHHTLILSPRYTPDSIALAGEATSAGWRVERLPSWRAPGHLRNAQTVIYGEPLFVAAVCEALSLVAFEAPFSWLADIPYKYRLREVEFVDLAKARSLDRSAFIKPADDKCFQAAVYNSGRDLPSPDALPESTPVLISEPVCWAVEFRSPQTGDDSLCLFAERRTRPVCGRRLA